jgi:hypothetical protein
MNGGIIFNETDFEENIYDFFTFMMYKGEPFTGTLIQPEYNWTTEFKNGNADGRNVEYYANGQLAHYEVYQDGQYISGKEWYPNGQIRYDSIGKRWYENGQLKQDFTGVNRLLYDKDGTLARQNNTWLYKNGQKINDQLADGTIVLFSSTGEIALKWEKLAEKEFDPESKTYHFYKAYYYDNVLNLFCDELFTDYYIHIEFDESYRILKLLGWIGAIYAEDKQRGHDLIDRLINHPTKATSDHASYLKRLAIKKESGNKELTYWLEKSPFKVIIK